MVAGTTSGEARAREARLYGPTQAQDLTQVQDLIPKAQDLTGLVEAQYPRGTTPRIGTPPAPGAGPRLAAEARAPRRMMPRQRQQRQQRQQRRRRLRRRRRRLSSVTTKAHDAKFFNFIGIPKAQDVMGLVE